MKLTKIYALSILLVLLAGAAPPEVNHRAQVESAARALAQAADAQWLAQPKNRTARQMASLTHVVAAMAIEPEFFAHDIAAAQRALVGIARS